MGASATGEGDYFRGSRASHATREMGASAGRDCTRWAGAAFDEEILAHAVVNRDGFADQARAGANQTRRCRFTREQLGIALFGNTGMQKVLLRLRTLCIESRNTSVT
jgi:hypothetical protein